ncbi:hypothetical protein C8R47DRAFT_1227229 [Mycena vitilis]|nr:hypothetical protein C8R47DRAFT_1227229 [Mycena vitilis]
MQFNVAFLASALLASVSLALSATVTGFAGADCSGTKGESFNVPAGGMLHLGRRLGQVHPSYSGIPNSISFFISGGKHDTCTSTQVIVRVKVGLTLFNFLVVHRSNWESTSVS